MTQKVETTTDYMRRYFWQELIKGKRGFEAIMGIKRVPQVEQW